jgi:hypothetical protein
MPEDIIHDIPVMFGGLSIGDAFARLGVRADRESLTLIDANEIWCGHRLTGSVVLGGHDDQSGQQKLVDDLEHKIDGVFDVKRYSVSPSEIAASLAISLIDLDIAELAKFTKNSGRLQITGIDVIPDESSEELERHDLPGSLASDGPWRDVAIKTLFPTQKKILASLKAAKLTTMGDIADYTINNSLSDVPGIGPGLAEKIERRLEDYWQDNPQE